MSMQNLVVNLCSQTLGVRIRVASGRRVRSLVNTWGLVERRGQRGDSRFTLSAEGIRYVTHRDRAQLPTTQGIWSTALTTDRQGRRRHVGHRIDTWARQTKHADGITWFLSELEAETRADPDSELEWSVPTARSDRAYNWGDSAIAPDAVGHLVAHGLHVPFPISATDSPSLQLAALSNRLYTSMSPRTTPRVLRFLGGRVRTLLGLCIAPSIASIASSGPEPTSSTSTRVWWLTGL